MQMVQKVLVILALEGMYSGFQVTGIIEWRQNENQKKSVNQNLTLKKSHAEFLSRINKFGCTLFAELCNCNTWAIPQNYFRLFWINPQKSLLKLSHPKKYLVNFLSKKSLNWKFRTLQKSFDHPCPLTIWSTSLGVLVKARKVLLFFPYNFHQNELIHLHSKRIHQVFHTNCKRSRSTQGGYEKSFVRLEPIKKRRVREIFTLYMMSYNAHCSIFLPNRMRHPVHLITQCAIIISFRFFNLFPLFKMW